jgi:hypothetical protein
MNKPLVAYLIGKLKNFVPTNVIKYINHAIMVNDVLIIKLFVKIDWIAKPEIKAKDKNSSPIPSILKTSL